MIDLHTDAPFEDFAFPEWEPPIKGKPEDGSEGEEMIPANGYGALAT